MSILLMMVGGSSGSTAGGLKTVTVGVLLLALRAGLTGREQVTFRARSIPFDRVLNAMTLTVVFIFLFLTGVMVISTVEQMEFLSVAFEVTSAMNTVGLTTGITPALTPISQGILILLMYLGRVGVMSFSIAFLTARRRATGVYYPSFDLMIG